MTRIFNGVVEKSGITAQLHKFNYSALRNYGINLDIIIMLNEKIALSSKNVIVSGRS